MCNRHMMSVIAPPSWCKSSAKKVAIGQCLNLAICKKNSSFIFRNIVVRDNGMMLLKSTVLLLLKDKICIAHYSCNFYSV
jgi:hypothetical protein